MPFISMVVKVIQAAQELTEALKNTEPEAPNVQIGENQLGAIESMAKIFRQQVQGKINPHKVTMLPPRVGISKHPHK